MGKTDNIDMANYATSLSFLGYGEVGDTNEQYITSIAWLIATIFFFFVGYKQFCKSLKLGMMKMIVGREKNGL